MNILDRRDFLSILPRSLGALAPLYLSLPKERLGLRDRGMPLEAANRAESPCWLDVCAPFIVEDPTRRIHSEIVLTSDTFVGARGYADGADVTEYEIYLYDFEGGLVGRGVTRRLMVPAMQTTVVPAGDLIGEKRSFWGGLKIRLRPRTREPMHASDLFSSAFVRWRCNRSFDNVHANPDPLQWQKAESFYYSMPFPSLAEYDCRLGLFNPYDQPGKGRVTLYEPTGNGLAEISYELKPHASSVLWLNAGEFVIDSGAVFGLPSQSAAREESGVARAAGPRPGAKIPGGGMLVVINDSKAVKSFAYLFIQRKGAQRFSVEHPIHQPAWRSLPVREHFDANGRFRAQNVLFTPLVFRSYSVAGITLESRFHFCTGLPLEEALWLYPIVADSKGEAVWQAATEPRIAGVLPASQIERGVIRLSARQSCSLDFTQLDLKKGFSGGLSLAVAPDSTHTLMKVEVLVPEWGAHAFTHFRPGIRSARSYQEPKQRGGLATDYITSGARLERGGKAILFDELIGVMNIDDRGLEGRPVLEVFGSKGLLARIRLGSLPGFACRHYLLSDLIGGDVNLWPLSLRLVDEQAVLLMSTLHIDHLRHDIALDHGSDRFSTFTDYGCNTTT